jgi:hypothetical protein
MNQHSPPSDQDHFEAARQYQEYYDDALREVGVRIPSPVLGQTVRTYRRETLHALQQSLLRNHPLNKVDFRELKNDSLTVLEPQALKACVTERVNPANYAPGEIKPIKVRDETTGHVKHTMFVGGLLPNGEQTCFTKELGR